MLELQAEGDVVWNIGLYQEPTMPTPPRRGAMYRWNAPVGWGELRLHDDDDDDDDEDEDEDEDEDDDDDDEDEDDDDGDDDDEDDDYDDDDGDDDGGGGDDTNWKKNWTGTVA